MAHDQVPLVRCIISEEERVAVDSVLRSGQIAAGTQVKEFEQAFANYCGATQGIATSNGTTALHAALLAAGIAPGDRVLTTPLTFIASTNSIRHSGAVPVFADIDPVTYALDPQSARRVLKADSSIKAILLVHLYGLPCDMDEFVKIRDEFGVLLIEDCAQAHGAMVNSAKVGSIGDIAAFSFYATKNMSTGEGGMVLTSNPKFAETCRKIINHGRTGQYEHDLLGYNYRLTNMAAALGIEQLKKLDPWNEKRRAIAASYAKQLGGIKDLALPMEPLGRKHVYHQYTVRTPRRTALKEHLAKVGIQSAVIYPLANCRQPLYRELCIPSPTHQCAQAVAASQEVLSIPVSPHLTSHEVERVISGVRGFFQE